MHYIGNVVIYKKIKFRFSRITLRYFVTVPVADFYK